jgi:hypothetical protein
MVPKTLRLRSLLRWIPRPSFRSSNMRERCTSEQVMLIPASSANVQDERNHPSQCLVWQGQQGSNPRPTVLETVALPTELYPYLAWRTGASGTRKAGHRTPCQPRLPALPDAAPGLSCTDLITRACSRCCHPDPPPGARHPAPRSSAAMSAPVIASTLRPIRSRSQSHQAMFSSRSTISSG